MIFVIYGEEHFLMDRERDSILCKLTSKSKKDSRLSVIRIDAAHTNWNQLCSRLGSVSLDSIGTRAFVVDNAEVLKVPTKAKPLEVPDPVIVMVRKPKVLKALETVLKGAKQIECQTLKTWSNNNQVVKWIQREAEALNLMLDANVPGFIYRMVGKDLYTLANDLRKIRDVYHGTGRSLTVKDVMPCLTTGCSVDPFEIVDAALSKDLSKTFNLLALLYKTSGEDPSMSILGCLSGQVEKFLVTKYMSMPPQSSSPDEMAARFDMNLWKFKTSILPYLPQHEYETLKRAYVEVARLDTTLKGSGARFGRTHLESILFGLCRGFPPHPSHVN